MGTDRTPAFNKYRSMKIFSKEVQIALVAVAGVVVLFIGLQFLKGLNVFANSNVYYVAFKDISGLSASSPVYANGYKVGVVRGINYDYTGKGHIIAEVDLDREMLVPVGSHAEISSDFMGNVKMNLILSDNPLQRMSAGDTIPGGQSTGLMEKAATMMPTLEKMMPKMDSILASLNALLADPAIAQSLHHVNEVTGNLVTTTNEANQLLAQLNAQVPAMLGKTNQILDETSQLTGQLKDIDVATTMAKVNSTLDNVENLTARLSSKEGTLGLLMSDPQLYYNLSSTMGSADSLLKDLRLHPKRYVHFSLFGKKDK